MSSLAIDITRQDAVWRVVLTGSADMTAAQALKKQLEDLVQSERPIVVVDMAGVGFICSMALGAFIYAHHQCRERGGELILSRPCTTVRMLMRTTQLDQFFTICDTQESVEQKIREIQTA